MNLSPETNGRYVDRLRSRPAENAGPRPRTDYALIETDITDLAQAASRIDALRSLILIFLREVDSLKKIVGPRPRRKGDPIKLDNEMDAFEASLNVRTFSSKLDRLVSCGDGVARAFSGLVSRGETGCSRAGEGFPLPDLVSSARKVFFTATRTPRFYREP